MMMNAVFYLLSLILLCPWLKSLDVNLPVTSNSPYDFECRVTYCNAVLDERRDGHLIIGRTRVPIRADHDAAALVPDVLFYDNQQVDT